ncbi:glutathione synthase/RimK-type ligase-like ATP-grasp enzyme [Evansella vedderi]|uniref:Glutathione synthase/RimK-type ligase-like ATP-grasp enzyme n=1 Tax=Evansella vedderi TaxID=38282 RepID=A0ABT9ZTL0_9BACI|nr:YheC/YheD family protein [Evansella vedderi]MDQ0254199.1 glutathione synthase/RimK-type ligase-like ATP-grasp enzyme [Evansella vedderi]
MINFTFYISHIRLNEKLKTNQLIIPNKIASIWKLPARKYGKLNYHFLSKEVEIVVEPHLSEFEIEMNPHLLSQLYLPEEGKIQCQYSSKENSFYFGPSVGIVLGDVLEKGESPFGPLTAYITDMAKAAIELYCPLIVFSYKEVEGSFVHAFIFEENSWKKGYFPLPHVIYNRIGRRDQERSDKCQLFFEKLTEMGIPYFNDRFLHKWHTFSFFLQEPTLTPYLPETRQLQSKKDLFYMLEKYPTIYLKPFWGKEGSGIIRIQKEKDLFIITYPNDDGWQTKKEVNLPDLFFTLKGRLKKRKYLIQQGIDMMIMNEAPVDFRVLCIKDTSGYWRTCSAIGRVGQRENIVSNLSKGGSQRKALLILEELMSKEKALQVERFLHELSVHCAQVLDAEAGGLFGELGFDFMVDKREHVWILEVNIKPSKSEFTQNGNQTPPSIKLLLTFAASLAGFIDK